MAALEGGDDARGTLFDVHPMAWFIVPAAIFLASMVVLMLVRYRRRRRAAMKAQWGTTNIATNTSQRYPPTSTRPWPYTSTTPSWSQRARNLAGFKRGDNGLNEFGEAPPAYTGPTSNYKTARASMSTSSSSVPQMRFYGMPATNPAPMGSVSIPMPGGPPTYHAMSGAGGYRIPTSPTSATRPPVNAGLSQPQAAVIR
ncbi:uncharacterized protein B0I36DRAFT_367973 [Microdochium trichocladiopsis]|uniref:Uncharacterized protein n=1 Tax=Microdochium trichocladiopsis TaxID=1682393 RepID=A0A9P9BKV2_9PEZI|nr:uncharacterized protein B0I36DRAFT_367973 [Microdochium trichocladiopsis]KAH7021596.1 hypothetical protein B0I36DRAFT_367973 [Microdochium trichocladiopsis]